MADVKKVYLVVSGRVQGVFYRAETKKMAESLGLFGWTRNLPTGDVAVYAIGLEEQLKKLIQWCQHGPNMSEVKEVKEDWDRDLGESKSFDIKY